MSLDILMKPFQRLRQPLSIYKLYLFETVGFNEKVSLKTQCSVIMYITGESHCNKCHQKKEEFFFLFLLHILYHPLNVNYICTFVWHKTHLNTDQSTRHVRKVLLNSNEKIVRFMDYFRSTPPMSFRSSSFGLIEVFMWRIWAITGGDHVRVCLSLAALSIAGCEISYWSINCMKSFPNDYVHVSVTSKGNLHPDWSLL